MKKNNPADVNQVLGDVSQMVLKDLGLENADPIGQAEVIASIGQNIMDRVLLEVLKVIPQNDHDEFHAILEKGSPVEIRDFLKVRITDFDQFVQHYAAQELEATKTRANMIAQGV